MTWEETIIYVRSQPEFEGLVADAYLGENLKKNVEDFCKSEEFREIVKLLGGEGNPRLVEVGSGNGIAAVSFARLGYEVLAVEPDSSNTVGLGAIEFLKNEYQLHNLSLKKGFGEETGLPGNYFDIYFTRQCMHHASSLPDFVLEAFRILKPGGVFLSVRDHVIFDQDDKALFLKHHPLHHFYDGENAFTLEEYKEALGMAGFEILKVMDHFSSPINYYPTRAHELAHLAERKEALLQDNLVSRIGALGSLNLIFNLYKKYLGYSRKNVPDERDVAGRMYSFLAEKPR